jgi:hypothetical protein
MPTLIICHRKPWPNHSHYAVLGGMPGHIDLSYF